MQHVPACRPNGDLQLYWYAQAAPRGVAVQLALYSDVPCALPSRPKVQLFFRGRPVAAEMLPWPLGAEYVPRRVLRPKQPAQVFVRWQNWCGPSGGAFVLRVTLGGETRSESLRAAPSCTSRASPTTLAVSRWVRR